MIELALLVGFIFGFIAGVALGADALARARGHAGANALPPELPPPPVPLPLACPPVDAGDEIWNRYLDARERQEPAYQEMCETWDAAMREATAQLKEWKP